MAELRRNAHVTGDRRAQVTAEVVRAYAKGASVRELAEAHGRSYGFVHNLLAEADTPMRRRGRNTLPRKTTPT